VTDDSPEIADQAETGESSPIIQRAFGETNRARLIGEWFAERGTPTSENAWADVYRLLLSIDRTTGLAHCYESDKSQPGRHWYGRSLIFHDWLAKALGATPADLPKEIDWLFKRATEDLAATIARQKERAAATAIVQRKTYEGRGFPLPGEDPELVAIVLEVLGDFLAKPVPDEVWRLLTDRVRSYLGQENKRRNLVGEGFEDVLREIVARVPSPVPLEPLTRVPIGDVPGFNAAGKKEKIKKVDLFVRNAKTGYRTLVTAKWSIRADREEQFASDFEAYARLEKDGEPFDYTLVTNEFDAARLLAACDRRTGNQSLFAHVVHVNPRGVAAVYGDEPQRSAEAIAEHIKRGRLIGLDEWLQVLPSRSS
jgi:hypothetical protein